MLPDVKRHLADAFPAGCTAAEASEIVTGRPDQVLLLSMWACLFGEAQGLCPEKLDEVLKFLEGAECVAAIKDFKAANDGIPPCPGTLVAAAFKE